MKFFWLLWSLIFLFVEGSKYSPTPNKWLVIGFFLACFAVACLLGALQDIAEKLDKLIKNK